MDAETKIYIDSRVKAVMALVAKKIGDTPREKFDLANKAYVDSKTATGIEGRSHLASNQNIAINQGSTPQKLNFGTNDFANGITWDAGNHRFTALTAGVYIVGCYVAYKPSQLQAGVAYSAGINKNGSQIAYAAEQAGNANVDMSAIVVDVVTLAVADYIEFFGQTSSNSTIDMLATTTVGFIAKV